MTKADKYGPGLATRMYRSWRELRALQRALELRHHHGSEELHVKQFCSYCNTHHEPVAECTGRAWLEEITRKQMEKDRQRRLGPPNIFERAWSWWCELRLSGPRR